MINKTKTLIVKILKDQFLSGSLIMFIGINFFNASQMIYHFMSGRLLGTALYGDLAALISLVGIIGIVQIGINLTIIKFVASEKDEEKTRDFIKWIYRKSILVGMLIMVIVLITAPYISNFLNISNTVLIYLLAPILFMTIILSTQRSVLQGLIKFDKYVLSLFADALGKIGFTLVFFILGYALHGALLGFLIGIGFGLWVTYSSLSKYLSGPVRQSPAVPPLIKYSLIALIQGAALTSMYSTDLLLVKHFLSAEEAGIYAALAILGRIVFFGTTPIIHVMFPIVAKRHLNGEKYQHILYLSLVLIIVITLAIIFFYAYWPGLFIGLLYGKSYLQGASMLWLFAVFMGLLSIATLFTHFFMSIGKTKGVFPLIVASIIQATLIWFIHPNITTIILLSIATSALLVFCLLVYFFYLNYRYESRT